MTDGQTTDSRRADSQRAHGRAGLYINTDYLGTDIQCAHCQGTDVQCLDDLYPDCHGQDNQGTHSQFTYVQCSECHSTDIQYSEGQDAEGRRPMISTRQTILAVWRKFLLSDTCETQNSFDLILARENNFLTNTCETQNDRSTASAASAASAASMISTAGPANQGQRETVLVGGHRTASAASTASHGRGLKTASTGPIWAGNGRGPNRAGLQKVKAIDNACDKSAHTTRSGKQNRSQLEVYLVQCSKFRNLPIDRVYHAMDHENRQPIQGVSAASDGLIDFFILDKRSKNSTYIGGGVHYVSGTNFISSHQSRSRVFTTGPNHSTNRGTGGCARHHHERENQMLKFTQTQIDEIAGAMCDVHSEYAHKVRAIFSTRGKTKGAIKSSCPARKTDTTGVTQLLWQEAHDLACDLNAGRHGFLANRSLGGLLMGHMFCDRADSQQAVKALRKIIAQIIVRDHRSTVEKLHRVALNVLCLALKG